MEEIENFFNNELNENSNENEIIIGIDLGTCNSCVSYWAKDKLKIIPDEYGYNTIPSIVSYTGKNLYVGWESKKQKNINPENTFYEVKKLIGNKFSNIVPLLKYFSYTITPTENDNILINNKFTPEEIISKILLKLKHMASSFLQKEIIKCVITVPAFFNNDRRQATIDAALIAGLNCIRIINEPIAACLSFGLYNFSIINEKKINVLVYDLGAGTLDLSLIEIYKGNFEVKSSVGNNHLGGSDFDNLIFEFCIQKFKEKNKLNEIHLIPLSIQLLKNKTEEAKIKLSSNESTKIFIKNFYMNLDLEVVLTKKMFFKICNCLIALCIKPFKTILEETNLSIIDIDHIILVGGMTKMPIIQDNIKNYFKKEINLSLDPDESISMGAAIQGFIIQNPLNPFADYITLINITQLSLGIEILNSVMDVIIPKNTPIPINYKKTYTTLENDEEKININVYQGERKMTKDNFLIGKFELTGLKKEPKGFPKIEVSFDIDQNNIITVSAIDKKNTNNTNKIIINGNKNRISDEKLKLLIDEAKNVDLIDKINQRKKTIYYELLLYSSNIEVFLKNEENNILIEEKKIIENFIEKLKNWLSIDNDIDDMENKLIEVREKYPLLILHSEKIQNSYIEKKEKIINSATVLDDDEENEDDCENMLIEQFNDDIDEDELLIKNQENKQMISEIKNSYLDIVYHLDNILKQPNLLLSIDHKNILNTLVIDSLIWIHTRQKLIYEEINNKIDMINNECNEILKNYENLIDNTENYIFNLQELCYQYKYFLNNLLYTNYNIDYIDLLYNSIDLSLDDIFSNKMTDEIAQIKIMELMELFNNVLNSFKEQI